MLTLDATNASTKSLHSVRGFNAQKYTLFLSPPLCFVCQSPAFIRVIHLRPTLIVVFGRMFCGQTYTYTHTYCCCQIVVFSAAVYAFNTILFIVGNCQYILTVFRPRLSDSFGKCGGKWC